MTALAESLRPPLTGAAPGGSTSGPIPDNERIRSVDVVRGAALLGILLLNIAGFALPEAGYYDGTIGSNGSVGNLGIWLVCQIFVEGKARALFSMLFGSGVILLTRRAESKGRDDVGDIYYRRTLWLVALGVIDSFLLLWKGDVLYDYGMSGLLLFPLRKLSPKALTTAGLVTLGILVIKDIRANDARGLAAAAASAAHRRVATTHRMTNADRATLGRWSARLEGENPDRAALADEVASQRAGYLTLVSNSAAVSVSIETRAFYLVRMWDVLSMMLIGMALLKLGFFTGEWQLRTYVAIAIVGYAIAIPINWYTANAFMTTGFSGAQESLLDARNQPGRLIMAFAHAAFIIACVRAGLFQTLTSRLASVGQMALTNYLMQTVICGVIFSGAGFGLFGRLDRMQLLGVVIAIWIVQLIASPLWLARYRFGPVEWLWRSLTYMRRQPMRRTAEVAALAPG